MGFSEDDRRVRCVQPQLGVRRRRHRRRRTPSCGWYGNLIAGTRSWLAGQYDPDLELDGWNSREERLSAFVEAASAVLAEDMRADGAPPTVSPVYVQQSVFGRASGSGTGPQTRARISAHTALTGSGDCVLLGEPGSGKTTTLHGGALELASRWRNGRGHWVPVFVRAGDLVGAGELPVALSAAVHAELGVARAGRSWSARFFNEPPEPASRWLLLVDGVDEILSEKHRRDVLALLRRATQRSGSPYQVVLTSRSLAEDAFTAWPELNRFRLLVLSKDSLVALARTRFGHAGIDDPDLAADEFLRAVGRTGIVKLSRVPLMATMLCELFIAQRHGALPRSRSELFQRYTDLLHDRMYKSGIGGVVVQLHAAVASYAGQAPAQSAEVLLDRVRDVVGTVALTQQEKPDRSALAMVYALTAADRPSRIPEETWQKVVRETFRRTGLLIQHGADLEFGHRYVGEFLAARHLTANRRSSWITFHRLFGWSGARTPLMSSPFREEKGTRRAEDQVSFCRFLISEWVRRPGMRLVLHRLVRGRRLRGLQNCRLVVMLIEDGTPVPDGVRSAAVRTLLTVATKDRSAYNRFEAAAELAKIEDSRGLELLEQFAVDSAQRSEIRLSAATELARSGGESAVPVLRKLAADTALHQEGRVSVALELARHDPSAAAVPLARLAQNKSLGPDLRLQTAIELILIDRELGQDALATLIGTYHNRPDRCLVVALELAKFEDPRAVDVLKTLARRDNAGFEVQFSAAVELQRLRDPEAEACLLRLATSLGVQAPNRLIAALELAKSARGPGLRLVHGFATDPARHPDFRKVAAVQLIQLHDPRGHVALVDLALGLPHDSKSKLDVLRALAGLREPLATRELALMADRTANPDSAAASEAALLLDRLVEVEGLDGWGGVARAADLNLTIRLDAVQRLGRIATVRARALLHELRDDRGLDSRVRDAARHTLA